MPPKELQKLPEIYVLEPDGTKIKLGEVKDFSVTYDDYYSDDPWDPNPVTMTSQEYEFTIKYRPGTELLHFITHGRLPTNNWRKMHGVPMKRRINARTKRLEKTKTQTAHA